MPGDIYWGVMAGSNTILCNCWTFLRLLFIEDIKNRSVKIASHFSSSPVFCIEVLHVYTQAVTGDCCCLFIYSSHPGVTMKMLRSVLAFCLVVFVFCGNVAFAAVHTNPEGIVADYTVSGTAATYEEYINYGTVKTLGDVFTPPDTLLNGLTLGGPNPSFINHGSVDAVGRGRDSLNNPLFGLTFSGADTRLENYGTITARGELGSDPLGSGGYGIAFSGDKSTIMNHGTIRASAMDSSVGIYANSTESLFTNRGTILALSETKGKGFFFEKFESATLLNYGTITSKAGGGSNNSVGILYNGNTSTAFSTLSVTNHNSIIAVGEDEGLGIFFRIGDTTFDNHGTLEALGVGGQGVRIEGEHSSERATILFRNDGTVDAKGASLQGLLLRGRGLSIEAKSPADVAFINTGLVSAIGEGLGTGIEVSASSNESSVLFENRGAVIAQGIDTVDNGILQKGVGIILSSHDTVTGSGSSSSVFHNYGTLALAGTGTSLQMSANLNASGDGEATTSVVFHPDSTLVLAGGHIAANVDPSQMNPQPIQLSVNPGARLVSLAAAGMATGQTVKHMGFIQEVSAATTNEASSFSAGNNLTLGTAFSTHPGALYTNVDVAFTRLALPSDFVSGAAGTLLDSMHASLANAVDANGTIDPAYLPYFLAFTNVDNQPTIEAMRRAASRLNRNFSTQATASAMAMQIQTMRRANSLFSGKLAASTLAPASGDEPARTAVWAQPFYRYGKMDGDRDNSAITERVTGASFGGTQSYGPWVVGLGGHAMHSDFDGGSGYNANVTGFGVNAGIGRAFNCGRYFAPFVELSIGFSHFAIDQVRTADMPASIPPTTGRAKYQSDPNMIIYSGSLSASNRFDFGFVHLTPRVGAEYAHAKLGSYSETASVPGAEAHAWNMADENMDSFRSVLGIAIGADVSSQLSLEARADYYHEFADTNATLTAHSQNTPFSFKSEGQDMGRESFRLGAGVSWMPSENISLTLNYDFTGATRYQAHDVAVQVKYDF